ncbi:DEAD/DEAH box helicase [Thermaerobacter litoralis]
MAMNAFELRNRVVGDYERYVKSFVRIRDERLREYAEAQLESGRLWPDPLLQINPAYERGATLDELADQGVVHPTTAAFFRRDGRPIRLYRHQEEALRLAKQGLSYVVTTGTGSGKSLTYLIPIVDTLVRQPKPANTPAVRALLIYPMNALINSQEAALKTFASAYEKAYGQVPFTFAKYTGETPLEKRHDILETPPDILLTNYMMAELLLVRPHERRLVEAMAGNLQFLVLDELHTYRGRQGADVAMLVRRLRLNANNDKLVCVGTSATLISEGGREERRRAVAEVARRLFGVLLGPEQVVDETLQRITVVPAPSDRDALRAALDAPLPPDDDEEAFRRHPLAAWVETHFGVTEDPEDGRLVRHQPKSLSEAARELANVTGRPVPECAERLQAILDCGNRIQNADGEPLFAFRLHQFVAGGATLYATLEPPAERRFTARPQQAIEDDQGAIKPVYPLVFCRHCGQEYYPVQKAVLADEDGTRLVLQPLADEVSATDDDEDVEVIVEGRRHGYWVVDPDGTLWEEGDIERLPDSWLEVRRNKVRVRSTYVPYLPEPLWVYPDGRIAQSEADGAVRGWLLPKPFRFCLRCGAVHSPKRNDHAKLTELGQTGRSSSTTILSTSAITHLRSLIPDDGTAHKLLSFTDNRQDASLQAGHLNDFVLLVRVRAALAKALRMAPNHALPPEKLPQAVAAALALDPEEYAPAKDGSAFEQSQKALEALVEYLLYADLAHGWRIVQPNLERVGLLTVEFEGLREFCQDHPRWSVNEVLGSATPDERYRVVHAILEYMRQELALDAPVLNPKKQDELKRYIGQHLRRDSALLQGQMGVQWIESRLFVPEGATSGDDGEDRLRRLTARSAIGRYLATAFARQPGEVLATEARAKLIEALIEILAGHYLAWVRVGPREGLQVRHGMLRWRMGQGTPPVPNPVRQAWMREPAEVTPPATNAFYHALYQLDPAAFRALEAREHTGQVLPRRRVERENRFNEGTLPVLCCSPTMELGIDIRDLHVVHMRNLPPTPANYAQRSGRAGRSGQQALVLACAGQRNSHDQYYFDRPAGMVAGAVAPPAFDLTNQDMVRSHLQAMWLATTGIDLGNSMETVIDIQQEALPLRESVEAKLTLSPERRAWLHEQVKQLLNSLAEELEQAGWYQPGWEDQVLTEAPVAFRAAFNRWRTLFQQARERFVPQSAFAQADETAWITMRQALRERAVLLNQGEGSERQPEESEFYPYRYLAAEGFLPGYNFPRLPVYVWVEVDDRDQLISRSRFIGLEEFGPRNRLYHEGRRHIVHKVVWRHGAGQEVLRSARFCARCHYVVSIGPQAPDRCPHCNAALEGGNLIERDGLLEMHWNRAVPEVRITSDEEVRQRRPYNIETFYHFAQRPDGRPLLETAQVELDGVAYLQFKYAPQATLWRINQGPMADDAGKKTGGFRIDLRNGMWHRLSSSAGTAQTAAYAEAATPNEEQHVVTVFPYVTDTRNLLLIQIEPSRLPSGKTPRRRFVTTFAHALARAIRVVHQLEDQELAVETLDEDAGRILLYEAAEGGLGVLGRLVRQPHALATVARTALQLLHFKEDGKDTEEDREDRCVRACYRCLMSYGNQAHHVLLDRFAVRDALLDLIRAGVVPTTYPVVDEATYQAMLSKTHPASKIERLFLQRLWETGRRLPDPDKVHYLVPDAQVEADFYYTMTTGADVCVLCHGGVHNDPQVQEKDRIRIAKLQNLGYRVIVVTEATLDEVLATYEDVWGAGTGPKDA